MARRASTSERAARLLALIPYLTTEEPVSLAALAAATGASAEEIADDLVSLSMCGTPPYDPLDLFEVFVEEDGFVHTYSPAPGLDRAVRLSLAEARALLAALELAGFGAEDRLVALVGGAAESGFSAEDVRRHLRTAEDTRGTGGTYEDLQHAVASCEALDIEYWTAGRDVRERRVVRPYALAVDLGIWYLSAFCERVGAVRTFRLDRILEVRRTGRTFEPPGERPSPLPSFDASGLPRAEVLFGPEEDVSERDWPGAVFERHENGTVTARVPYSSPGWVARRIAARLGGAEAISPPEVREAVAALARRESR